MDCHVQAKRGYYLAHGNSVLGDSQSEKSTIVEVSIGNFCRVSPLVDHFFGRLALIEKMGRAGVSDLSPKNMKVRRGHYSTPTILPVCRHKKLGRRFSSMLERALQSQEQI